MYNEVLHNGLIIPECTCNPQYREECMCEGRQDLVRVEVDPRGTTHVYPIDDVAEEYDGRGQIYVYSSEELQRDADRRAARIARGPRGPKVR